MDPNGVFSWWWMRWSMVESVQNQQLNKQRLGIITIWSKPMNTLCLFSCWQKRGPSSTSPITRMLLVGLIQSLGTNEQGWRYCWWFRNPASLITCHLWNPKKNLGYSPNINWCKISEPSTYMRPLWKYLDTYELILGFQGFSGSNHRFSEASWLDSKNIHVEHQSSGGMAGWV